MAKQFNIERENLEAHVDLCSQRFDGLIDKIGRLEARMDGVETHLRDICLSLGKMNQRYNSYWFKVGGGVITILLGIIAWLASYVTL